MPSSPETANWKSRRVPAAMAAALILFVAGCTNMKMKPAADLIITNTQVWTVDDRIPSAEAVAVLGEQCVPAPMMVLLPVQAHGITAVEGRTRRKRRRSCCHGYCCHTEQHPCWGERHSRESGRGGIYDAGLWRVAALQLRSTARLPEELPPQ